MLNQMAEEYTGEKEVVIVHRQTPEQMARCFMLLRQDAERRGFRETFFLRLGTKVVRILNFAPELSRSITTMFACSLTEQLADYDTTIVMWKPCFDNQEVPSQRLLMDARFSEEEPVVIIDARARKITGYDADGNTHFFGIGNTMPEELSVEGHLAVRFLYPILKTPTSSLIHGACIGHEGKGVLLCARGNRGKSTLAVLGMLQGMEYVSDDYMLLTQEGNQLYTDPIYSIITLSPQMYNEMYDELASCRFVSNNWNKSKYVLEVSAHHERFRYHYPVALCMFPEITDDAEPSITPCSVADKGRAITHLVHSTTSQMQDQGDARNTVKLMMMLKGQKFYRFNLCRDIRKNVVFLRNFLTNH